MLEMMETLLEVIMRNATTKLSFGYVQKIGPPQQISHRHRQMTAWKLMVWVWGRPFLTWTSPELTFSAPRRRVVSWKLKPRRNKIRGRTGKDGDDGPPALVPWPQMLRAAGMLNSASCGGRKLWMTGSGSFCQCHRQDKSKKLLLSKAHMQGIFLHCQNLAFGGKNSTTYQQVQVNQSLQYRQGKRKQNYSWQFNLPFSLFCHCRQLLKDQHAASNALSATGDCCQTHYPVAPWATWHLIVAKLCLWSTSQMDVETHIHTYIHATFFIFIFLWH